MSAERLGARFCLLSGSPGPGCGDHALWGMKGGLYPCLRGSWERDGNRRSRGHSVTHRCRQRSPGQQVTGDSQDGRDPTALHGQGQKSRPALDTGGELPARGPYPCGRGVVRLHACAFPEQPPRFRGSRSQGWGQIKKKPKAPSAVNFKLGWQFG